MIANLSQRISGSGYRILLAALIGLLLGLSIVFVSPWLAVAAVAAGFFGWFILKRPELCVLGIIVLTSTIFYDNANPGISIGIGHIYLNDLMLVVPLFIIVIRSIAEPDYKLIHTPLDVPLLLFVGLAFLSTFLAIANSSLTLQNSLGELRVVANYLVFFLITNLLKDEKKLRVLARGLLILSVFVALAMIYQFLLGGSQIILPGRIETLQTGTVSFLGVTRVLPPGQALILPFFIVTTVVLVLASRRRFVLDVVLCGLLGIAILITFNRNFWVQSLIALAILLSLIQGKEWLRFITISLSVIFLGVTIFLLAPISSNLQVTNLLNAGFDRFGTIFQQDTLSSDSLQERVIEDTYAIPQIISHPLVGLGLGATYRSRDSRLDSATTDLTGYIHNGHFYIMMKAGFLAYVFLLWLSVVFLVRSFKYWRLVRDLRLKAYVLGFTLTYTGILVGAIVNPIFIVGFWTPVIGIMMGFNEAMIRLSLDKMTALPVPGEAK